MYHKGVRVDKDVKIYGLRLPWDAEMTIPCSADIQIMVTIVSWPVNIARGAAASPR